MSYIVTAMRRADMLVRHPNTDYTHVCSKCGKQLGIYPSTVKLLAQHPDTVLICNHCNPGPPKQMVPGAEDEIGTSAVFFVRR
jgi:hypothetical protein